MKYTKEKDANNKLSNKQKNERQLISLYNVSLFVK